MSKFILLYNYNKYYNRIIKKLETYNEYKALITPVGSTPAQYNGLELKATNFDYQDGVFARHVINIPSGSSEFFQAENPDYLVLEQSYKYGNETITKLSRWFILETTKIRGNQFELSLKRDLLADYYISATTAPVFIEKGNPTINDPAIFNKESMTYNQIKKKELLLNFDKHSGRGNGWIVGYLKQADTPYQIQGVTGRAELPNVVPNYSELPSELRTFIQSGSAKYTRSNEYVFGFTFRKSGCHYNGETGYNEPTDNLIGSIRIPVVSNYVHTSFLVDNSGVKGDPTWASVRFKNGTAETWDDNLIGLYCRDKINDYLLSNPTIQTAVNQWFSSLNLSNVTTTDYSGYNGLVYLKDGKYYRLRIVFGGLETKKVNYTESQVQSQSTALAEYFKDIRQTVLWDGSPSVTYTYNHCVSNSAASNAEICYFEKELREMVITSEEVEYDDVKCDIPSSGTRNQNLDGPYDLFCIPMANVVVKNGVTTLFTCIENIATAIARGISIAGGSNVLDIQILPYCPFEEILNNDGDINIAGFTEGKDFSYIKKNVQGADVNCGIIVYPKKARGTFDMTITSNQEGYSDCVEETVSIIDKKVKSETVLCRFVSPNFASTFDINVQKNKGITRLNVDYFYKPYSPYIHVAPYFSGLYGSDFNDPKGLICNGDFSIALAQSEWENYQIQNKNFELIFNRQIQNLDVNNSIAYEQAAISAGLGQGTSLLAGAGAGAIAGGTLGSIIPGIGTVVGAAAGAVIGGAVTGVASGIGAKYDLEYLKKSQNEARSYAVDMYGYSLGNIQALPYTLTRVSAFTQNNKIFPFIEFYDATNEEKETLRNKIKYNGMTIMRIGRISDFSTEGYRYVQGQLIRLEGIDEDSHVVAEIANEIKLGAYYYGTNTI